MLTRTRTFLSRGLRALLSLSAWLLLAEPHATAQTYPEALRPYFERGAEATTVPERGEPGAGYFYRGAEVMAPKRGEPGWELFFRGADVTNMSTVEEGWERLYREAQRSSANEDGEHEQARALSEREELLDAREQELDRRQQALDAEAQELERREQELEWQRQALEDQEQPAARTLEGSQAQAQAQPDRQEVSVRPAAPVQAAPTPHSATRAETEPELPQPDSARDEPPPQAPPRDEPSAPPTAPGDSATDALLHASTAYARAWLLTLAAVVVFVALAALAVRGYLRRHA